jgi:hypothetical protein
MRLITLWRVNTSESAGRGRGGFLEPLELYPSSKACEESEPAAEVGRRSEDVASSLEADGLRKCLCSGAIRKGALKNLTILFPSFRP